MSKLKDQLIELQNDKVKSQIRISGLNLHQKAKHGSENSVQSYEVTKQLMDAMNLKITNFDCWRVAPKEKAGKNDLLIVQQFLENQPSHCYGTYVKTPTYYSKKTHS